MGVTWWEKLSSPLPWLPWMLVALVLVGAVLWAIDRIAFRSWDIVPQLKGGNVAVAIVVAAVIWLVGTMAERAAFGATGRYDPHFRRAAVTVWGVEASWQWFKAQGMAESGLRAHVCSHVGACGLMQFMPGTAREYDIDPFRPRQAIWAGVRYDRRLWRQWSAPRPAYDRLALAFASYNAGLGNVLAFQRAAGGANTWPAIAAQAWDEPRTYVERITRWCGRFARGPCTPWPRGQP